MNHIIEQQKERAREKIDYQDEFQLAGIEEIITQTHQATFQDTLAEVIMIAESMKESNKLYYNKPLDVLIETLVRKKCKYKE